MSGNNSKDQKPHQKFSRRGFPFDVSTDIHDDVVGSDVTRRIDIRGLSTATQEPRVIDAPAALGKSRIIKESSVEEPMSWGSVISSPPSGWNVEDATVLPEFHPLERSAVFVPNRTPAEVASRISSVLRERSIQAEYHGAKAKCLTPDNVDFRIFLYRGQKQYSHGIIVEVQRRFGNSESFYADTQAILDAAEGRGVEAPLKKSKTIPLVEEDHDENPISSSSLDFVGKMLNHPGADAQFLAFQILSSITDSEKMGKDTAAKVAENLLSEGNEVGSKVLDVMLRRQDEIDEFGVRLMALTVLSNAIASLKGNVSFNLQSTLWPIMARELDSADVHTQRAYVAAKCLKPLLRDGLRDRELCPLLLKALQVGKRKHSGLAEQAELCLAFFDY